MSELKQKNINPETQRRRIGLWASAVFTGLGLVFLIFWFYNVLVLQEGVADLSDKILLPVTILMLASGLAGFLLIWRGRLVAGLWTVFSTVLIPPIAAVFILDNVYIISLSYIAVFAPLAIGLVFPRPSRRAAIIAAGIAVLLIAGIQLWNPSFRFSSTSLVSFAPFAIAAGVLSLLVFAISQAWSGNIRVKLVTSFTVVALISVTIVGVVVYNNFRNQMRDDIRQRLLDIISITALHQDGDLHDTLKTEADMKTAAYAKMQAVNQATISSIPDLAYIYTMALDEEGQIYFVLDVSPDLEYEPVITGTIYDDPSELLAQNIATLDHTIAEEDFYTDIYGTFLSAYAPFYRSDGSVAGIVGVDIFADKVIEQERQVLTEITITTGVALVIVVILGLVLGNLYTRPITRLASVAQQVADGNLSARARVETKDEVGNLTSIFNNMTAQLQETLTSLEQRVAARTKALATVAEIGAASSTILETGALLQNVVDLSKERFSLYHTHIYLLNENGDALVLASGAGEPGRRMVEQGHSIPLDAERSLVARAARERRGVTVNDVTREPDFLPNSLLPDTRAELAVPMIVGDSVIGVFDVQSETAGRFTDADISVQTTLASQVASAVQNARLYTQAETSKEEAQLLVQYAPEAIVVVDLTSGLFTDPNQNAEKLYGLSHDELLKVGPAQMSPPQQPDGRDSTEKVMEKINDAMQGKSPIFEWMHRNAQGEDILCEIRLVRLPGARPRVRASVNDITERKHLEELTALRARQLAAVAEISTASSQELEVDKLLSTVVRLTQRQFGLYHAHVFVFNETAEELRVAACGWKEGDEHEGTTEVVSILLDQEQSLVARAARTRQAVIVNDARNEPGWLPNPSLPDTASEMAVPLVIGDRVLGVLDVQSDHLNAFTEEDANIQTTLASQVATAMQNARSFAQAQKQAERETMLNAINQKIQSATSVEAVLQIAARELGHALGAPMTIAQLSLKGQNQR